MMFSVFRETKYDDIGPNHTKENKNNNKNNNKTTKNQHTLFLIFMDRTRNFFGPGFPQTKRCKNIEVWEFSRDPDIPRVSGKLPKIKVI